MTENGKQNSNENKGVPIFDLWCKYEEIAMHFNDLIVKIRIQALGAVAAIATIAGVLLSKSSTTGDYSWGAISAVLFFLLVFWLAIWFLDIKYYNCLLQGAVKEIKKVEELSRQGATHVKDIELSTQVENAVLNGAQAQDDEVFSCGRTSFYRVVFLALIVSLIFTQVRYWGCPV